MSNLEPISIYVHVPFCEQKCAYCDFFTITDPDKSHPLYDSWLELCARELELWYEQHKIDTARPIQSLFFGGGTPSLLPPEQYARFIRSVRERYNISPRCEISLETQPATISPGDYALYAEAGINRFSVGVQTFNDNLLAPTKRRHTVEEALQTVHGAAATNQTVSIDLICAHPDQTLELWESDLKQTESLPIRHISIYEMTFHQGTEYFRNLRRGTISEIDEDTRITMFELADEKLLARGFDHYEISNYALPGYESVHNSNYWKLGDYIGLGAGAHGYIHPHRRQNPRHAGHYAAAIRNGNLFAKLNDAADPDITRIENLTAALRYKDGVNIERFHHRYGCDIMQWRPKEISRLQNDGFIIIENGFIRLTKTGRLQTDAIAESLL